ncbi:MAG TPA: GH1 family beta-glucosidase [Fervidobacterium sp.]|nr:GH1 family beta-glucosidase [Fervidobacterium sp.]HON03487.1 GH1 family beta-glucosidase [Fervidobacterium sp.]HPP18346.1 GH1 family beta-glucosidase [Fervidobacterium sp.]
MIRRSDFPKNFYFGTATASYQIEGAVDEDGKGPSIWDVFSHTPGKTFNGNTGDIACDHYHRYKEDIQIMKDIGLNAYRFSISWPRIMPDGKNINQKGIDFYNRLVDELLEADITPFVTLYHWDLPYALQENGGWLNPDIAMYFRAYATFMFDELGDRVKHWITLNEPWCSSFLGYFTGEHAPGHQNLQEAIFAAHNLLRAHGYAVQSFREEVKDGEVGLTNVTMKVEPGDSKPESFLVAGLVDKIVNAWFHDPVVFGKYPEEAVKNYLERGIQVPSQDLEVISSPIDFFGVNYYTRTLVAYDENSPLGFSYVQGDLPKTEMGWEIYPQGLFETLVNLKERYKLPLYITENGMAGPDKVENGRVKDTYRIEYLEKHFESALSAIEAGVDLRGYFTWSLMDNFEWAHGYSKRFGIVYVDYATQKRILKDSALWLKDFIKS